MNRQHPPPVITPGRALSVRFRYTPRMTPLAIFLHSGRYDRAYQALNLLLTAASSGRPCYLFLFYGALAGFMDGSWDHPDTIAEPGGGLASDAVLRRAFELSDMPVPSEILEMVGREEGRLTVCACSTSMKLLDLPAGEVSKRVDHVAGLATMLEMAEGAQVLYI